MWALNGLAPLRASVAARASPLLHCMWGALGTPSAQQQVGAPDAPIRSSTTRATVQNADGRGGEDGGGGVGRGWGGAERQSSHTRSMLAATGLYGIPELSDPAGFQLLTDQAIARYASNPSPPWLRYACNNSLRTKMCNNAATALSTLGGGSEITHPSRSTRL